MKTTKVKRDTLIYLKDFRLKFLQSICTPRRAAAGSWARGAVSPAGSWARGAGAAAASPAGPWARRKLVLLVHGRNVPNRVDTILVVGRKKPQ